MFETLATAAGLAAFVHRPEWDRLEGLAYARGWSTSRFWFATLGQLRALERGVDEEHRMRLTEQAAGAVWTGIAVRHGKTSREWTLQPADLYDPNPEPERTAEDVAEERSSLAEMFGDG